MAVIDGLKRLVLELHPIVRAWLEVLEEFNMSLLNSFRFNLTGVAIDFSAVLPTPRPYTLAP
jgi:hypothetical protein